MPSLFGRGGDGIRRVSTLPTGNAIIENRIYRRTTDNTLWVGVRDAMGNMSTAAVDSNFRFGSPPVIVADDTARDTYFTNNAGELTQYDNDPDLFIAVGTGFQHRVSSAWVSAGAILKGEKGDQGDQGDQGNPGDSSRAVYIRSATTPPTPTGVWDGTTLTLTNGYSETIPTGTDKIWRSDATLDSVANTATFIAPQEIQGEHGDSVRGVYIRSATAPANPTGTYNGTTLTLQGGWEDTIPAGTDPLWKADAFLNNNTNTVTFTIAERWQGPQGLRGPRGDETFTVYQRAAAQPATPADYTWNGNYPITQLPAGWTLSDPDPTSTLILWAANLRTDIAGNRIHTTLVYSTEGVVGPMGPQGNEGPVGPQGNSDRPVYLRAASQPPTPTGTWDGTTLTVSGSWSQTIPAGSDPLYRSDALLDNVGNTATFLTPVLITGERGPQGIQGTAGAAGQNVEIQYSPDQTVANDTLMPGDEYIRFRIGTMGSWSPWHQFVGEDGLDGNGAFTFGAGAPDNANANANLNQLYRDTDNEELYISEITRTAWTAVAGSGAGIVPYVANEAYDAETYVRYQGLEYYVLQDDDGTHGPPDENPTYYDPLSSIEVRSSRFAASYTGASIQVDADSVDYADDPIDLIMDDQANASWSFDADTRTWRFLDQSGTLTLVPRTYNNNTWLSVFSTQSVRVTHVNLKFIKNRGRPSEERLIFVSRDGSNTVNGLFTLNAFINGHTGSLTFSHNDTLEIASEVVADPASDSQYVTLTRGNLQGNVPTTFDVTEGGDPIRFYYDETEREFVITDGVGTSHGVLDQAGQPVSELKSWSDERDLVPLTFYVDSDTPTLQYAAADFTWNATDSQFDVPAGVLRDRPNPVVNQLHFVVLFHTNEEAPVAHSILPTLPYTSGTVGPQGRPGLNAVSRTFTGTFVPNVGDVDTDGEVHWVNDTSVGNVTFHAADHEFWSSLRVGTLLTGRHDDTNYVQTRITQIINVNNPIQYEFEVLDVVGYLNGRTGAIFLDVSQSDSNEEIEYSNDNTTWSSTPPANYRYTRTRVNGADAWNVTDLEQGSVVYIQYSDDNTTWHDSLGTYSYVRVRGSAEDSWKSFAISTAGIDRNNVGQEIASCTLAAGNHAFIDNQPIAPWVLNANAPTGFSLREISGLDGGINLPQTKVDDGHLGYWVRIFSGTDTDSMHDTTFEVGAQTNSVIGGSSFPLDSLNLVVDPRVGDEDFMRIDATSDHNVTLTEPLHFRLYMKESGGGGLGHDTDIETNYHYFFTRSATTPRPADSYLISGTRGTDATLLPNEADNWHAAPNAISSTLSHLPLWLVIVRTRDFVREEPEPSPAIALAHADDRIRSHYDSPRVDSFTANIVFPDDTYIDGETSVTYTDADDVFELADTSGSVVTLRALKDVEGDLTLNFDAIRSHIGVIRNNTANAIDHPDTVAHIGRVYLNGNLQETYLIRAGGANSIAAGAESDIGSGVGDTVVTTMTITGVTVDDLVSIRFELAGAAPPDVSFKFANGDFNVGVTGMAALDRPREVLFGVDSDGDLYTQHGSDAPLKLLNEDGATGRLRGQVFDKIRQSQPSNSIADVEDFDNFIYWSFNRSVDGQADVDLCEVAFYRILDNGTRSLVEDDVTFQSDKNGRLNLRELADHCYGLRTRDTNPVDHDRRMSVLLRRRYAQEAGSVTPNVGDLFVTDRVFEIAYSNSIDHIAWSALGDSGVPMLNPLDGRTTEGATGISSGTFMFMTHFKFISVTDDTEVRIGDGNNWPALNADDNGLHWRSEHYDANLGSDIDFTQDAIMGVVSHNISGNNDKFTLFSNGVSVAHTAQAHSFTGFRVHAENAYLGDVFYTPHVNAQISDDFDTNIVKSKFDNTGVFGKIYNNIDFARQITFRYSADGSTAWNTTRAANDRYIQYSIDNGITWSESVLIQEVITQFSVDKSSWHDNMQASDEYWRIVIRGIASPALKIDDAAQALSGTGRAVEITGTLTFDAVAPTDLWNDVAEWTLTPNEYFTRDNADVVFNGNLLEIRPEIDTSENNLTIHSPSATTTTFVLQDAHITLANYADESSSTPLETITIAELQGSAITIAPDSTHVVPFEDVTGTPILSNIVDGNVFKAHVILLLDTPDTNGDLRIYGNDLTFNIAGTQRDVDIDVYIEDGRLKSRNPNNDLLDLFFGDAFRTKALRGPQRTHEYTPEGRFSYHSEWETGRTWHNLGRYFTQEGNRIKWHGPPVSIEITEILSQDSEEPQVFGVNSGSDDVTLTTVQLQLRRYESPNLAPTQVYTLADHEHASVTITAHDTTSLDLTAGEHLPLTFELDDGHEVEFAIHNEPAQTGTFYVSGGNVRVELHASLTTDGVEIDIETEGQNEYLRYTDPLLPDGQQETRLIELTAPQILIPHEPKRAIFLVEGQQGLVPRYLSSAKSLSIGSNDKVKIPFNTTAYELDFGATEDMVQHLNASDVAAYVDPPIGTGDESGVLEFQSGLYDLEAHLTIQIESDNDLTPLVALRRGRYSDIELTDHRFICSATSTTTNKYYVSRHEALVPHHDSIYRYDLLGNYEHAFNISVTNHVATAIAVTTNRIFSLSEEDVSLQRWARAYDLEGNRESSEDRNIGSHLSQEPRGAEYDNGLIYVLSGDNAGDGTIHVFTDDFSVQVASHSLPYSQNDAYQGLTIINDIIYVKQSTNIRAWARNGTTFTRRSDLDISPGGGTFTGLTHNPVQANTLMLLLQSTYSLHAYNTVTRQGAGSDEKLDDFRYFHAGSLDRAPHRLSLVTRSITLDDAEQLYYESDDHSSNIRVYGYLLVKQLKAE